MTTKAGILRMEVLSRGGGAGADARWKVPVLGEERSDIDDLVLRACLVWRPPVVVESF